MYILVILFLLIKTDQITSLCPTGYYEISGQCSNCYYSCHSCSYAYGRYACQSCVSPQCTCATACSVTYCPRFRCTNCIAGYYVDDSGDCYRCNKTNCACTTRMNCPTCLPGKYGSGCEHSCPDGCNNELCNKSNGHCEYGCISGRYGLTCQNPCSGLCKDNVCDQKTGACKNGCIDGYYSNSGVCSVCPFQERCVKCESSFKCTKCIPGKRGDTCQMDCHAGCKDNICDIDSDKCSLGSCENRFYFHWNTRKCYRCRSSCNSCSSLDACDTCISAQNWGSYCQYSCDTNCESGCYKESGCSRCKTGFYIQYDNSKMGYICSRCPERCSICDSASACIVCKHMFANRDTYHKCECKVDICTARSGYSCTQCPSPGWYPSGNACCPCHSNCKDNVCSSNGICTECVDGKYGYKCQYDCNSACVDRLCYQDGTCISCPDTSKYGVYCSNRCNQKIRRCAACLQQSNASVSCIKCDSGYYVDNNQCKPCNAKCNAGKSPVCNSTTGSCNYGCKLGFVGEKCDTSCHVSNCQSCTFDELSACSLCKDGFYLETVNNCSECPANCKTGTKCDAYNGTCIDGCSDFWSGQHCNKPCPQRCQRCEQSNFSVCGVCNIGFYGDGCEANCSLHCQYEDNVQVCNRNSGHCNFGCIDGFWDNKCRSVCGPGCYRSSCNITTGTCLYGCINDYFGEECKAKCNIHCKESETLPGRTCDELFGHCLKGCTPGWFGESCADKCSDQCNETVCNRKNGTCTFGCIDGYVGPNCTQAIVSADDHSTDVTAIAGAGAGFAILVIAVVSLLLWRRRQQRRRTSSNHFPTGSQGDDQQEEGYQNLTLNTLNIAGGLGTDIQARMSVSNSNIDVYQGLSPRTLSENTYSSLAAPNANINSHVEIDTAGYQNTALSSAATESSNCQKLISDFKDNPEYCSVFNE